MYQQVLKISRSPLVNELSTRTIVGLFFAGSLFLSILYLPRMISCTYLICIFLWIMLVEWPPIAKHTTKWLTFFYPLLPSILLITLQQSQSEFLYILSIAFTFDTSAYLAGTCFGKHRMAPSISMGKTWEGFCGGLFSIIVLEHFFWHQEYSWIHLLNISCFWATAANIGDLWESWLKRRAQIKNSGTILPGHGGLLDRFDSIYFLVLAYYATRYISA